MEIVSVCAGMQFLSSSAEGARNLGTKERKCSDREISQSRFQVGSNRATIRGNHVGTHTVRKQTNVFIGLFSLKVSGAPPGCSESTDVLAHTESISQLGDRGAVGTGKVK